MQQSTDRMFRLSLVITFVILLADLASGQEGDCGGSCQCKESVNGPLISFSCCLQVEENVPLNTFVGSASISPQLQQIGADASYNLGSGSAQSQFRINQTDGNIYTISAIDRESSECHILVITAIGGVNQETQRFVVEVIDTNDNSPIFTQGLITITIPETTTVNPTINCGTERNELLAVLASDSDEGQNSLISYSIQGSNVLSIPDPNTTLCIENSEPLDRDDPDYRPYEFLLIAQDNGNPPNRANVTVIMHLEGVNEFAPTFPSQNNIEIPENSVPGSVVHLFQATDNDSFDNPQQIRYTISGEPSDFPFELNETSGELILTGAVDAEADVYTFEFEVQAQDDGGMEGTLEVTLTIADVNEPAPVFTAGTQSSLTENIVTIGVVATLQVEDQDREQTNNSVEFVSGGDVFKVSSFGGSFFLQQTAAVDRENRSSVNVTVRLIERGDPTYNNQTITLLINVNDVNDNPPSLNKSTFDFVENQDSVFMKILLISSYVFDPDEGNNGEVSSVVLLSARDSKGMDRTENFIMANGNSRDLGPEGTLIAPPIDREDVGNVITITVMINDSGIPQLSSIETFTLRILDINDNAPVFDLMGYNFSLSENMNSSTLVGQVTATDPDEGVNGTVSYSLVSNSEHFSIDEESGEITSKRSFDRETLESPMFHLQVRATDKGMPPMTASLMATVYIRILDENDNSPRFTDPTGSEFDILTTDPVGHEVGRVMATDPDEGDNALIEYSLNPLVSNFNISSVGEITLNIPVTDEQTINLTVIASNPGNSDRKVMRLIHINVKAPLLTTTEMIIVGCVGGGVLIIVVLTILLLCCYCYHKRRAEYILKDPKTHLNNHPERVNSITKPILKSVPATTNGTAGGRERSQVSFSIRVDETHYKPEGAVTDNSKVLRKASITNFGSSDESPQVPIRDSPPHNGVMPSMQVLEYENSPGQHMNGITDDIPGIHSHYEMRHLSHTSPIHIRRDMTDNADFSQTSSTTDANDSEEESTFSDNASNMNTSIPCFPKDDPDLHRYGAPPPPHPPLYPHIHTSHMPSPSLLGIIHPGNMSSLAAPEGSYRSSQGNSYTIRHSQNHSNSDTSSQTTTPSPHSRHQMMGRMDPPGIRPIHSHTNGHNYSSRQLVMPDAYPNAMVPDMHRHVHDHYRSSFSDYGEASTYASIELDEALNCNYEPEPGFYSLTATDYDDHEDA